MSRKGVLGIPAWEFMSIVLLVIGFVIVMVLVFGSPVSVEKLLAGLPKPPQPEAAFG